MRAVVYDPESRTNLTFADVDEPEPAADQLVVDVKAIALNFGEIRWIADARQPGEIPGWDTAGVVAKAAADGSGPPAGARIVAFDWFGGWAQKRTAPTGNVAVLPDSVDFGTAAALPVAGVTALQALRALGPVVGRRVLVTGASGGVGRFAVQLASRAGAHVIAAVGSAVRGEGLMALGADEVVVGLDDVAEPVFGVLDNVGGPLLAQAFHLVGDGGSVQSIGKASGEPTTIDFEAERHTGARKRLEPFMAQVPFGPDLAYLVELVSKNRLDPQIGLRASWEDIDSAAEALLGRKVAGKAVLDVV